MPTPITSMLSKTQSHHDVAVRHPDTHHEEVAEGQMARGNHILTRWVRCAGMWEGQYAHRPTAGIAPSWTGYAWVYKEMGGYVLAHAGIDPCRSPEYPKLETAKKAASDLLLRKLGEYREAVARQQAAAALQLAAGEDRHA